MGLERLIRGVLKYREGAQKVYRQQLKEATANPNPAAVFIACMDARISPSSFTQAPPGDLYVMRNAGYMAPVQDKEKVPSAIAAGIELGCLRSSIKDVVVCGHSDCKAMNLLLSMRQGDTIHLPQRDSISEWVRVHGRESLQLFVQQSCKQPFDLMSPIPHHSLLALIDPEEKYNDVDRLSQLHCLKQMVNISGYKFLKQKLESNEVHLSAMWLDIQSAELLMFSRRKSQFVTINEENADLLLKERHA